MDPSHTIKLLRGRVVPDHESSKARIEEALRFLKHKLDFAQKCLADGEMLDEHLIHNAMGITHEIIHYNMTRDLLPYLQDPKETK
jgi:hypothetical protein